MERISLFGPVTLKMWKLIFIIKPHHMKLLLSKKSGASYLLLLSWILRSLILFFFFIYLFYFLICFFLFLSLNFFINSKVTLLPFRFILRPLYTIYCVLPKWMHRCVALNWFFRYCYWCQQASSNLSFKRRRFVNSF